MTSPSIVHAYEGDMIAPLFLAILTAAFFWHNVVPRQLKGLQVAFPTGPRTYEVHQVTSTVEDVRKLLARRGTRLGVASYLMALTGSLVLLFEFLNFRAGNSAGTTHLPSPLPWCSLSSPLLFQAGHHWALKSSNLTV